MTTDGIIFALLLTAKFATKDIYSSPNARAGLELGVASTSQDQVEFVNKPSDNTFENSSMTGPSVFGPSIKPLEDTWCWDLNRVHGD